MERGAGRGRKAGERQARKAGGKPFTMVERFRALRLIGSGHGRTFDPGGTEKKDAAPEMGRRILSHQKDFLMLVYQ